MRCAVVSSPAPSSTESALPALLRRLPYDVVEDVFLRCADVRSAARWQQAVYPLGAPALWRRLAAVHMAGLLPCVPAQPGNFVRDGLLDTAGLAALAPASRQRAANFLCDYAPHSALAQQLAVARVETHASPTCDVFWTSIAVDNFEARLAAAPLRVRFETPGRVWELDVRRTDATSQFHATLWLRRGLAPTHRVAIELTFERDGAGPGMAYAGEPPRNRSVPYAELDLCDAEAGDEPMMIRLHYTGA